MLLIKMKLPAFEAEFLILDEDRDKVFQVYALPFLEETISAQSMMFVLRLLWISYRLKKILIN